MTVHFLGTKDETAGILQYLIVSLETLCKLKVRRIRSDNGTQFKNNMMELFLSQEGYPSRIQCTVYTTAKWSYREEEHNSD
ncbi:hypothetical protein L1987_64927 [Smallanthus sonchifolius]|uniref:Uncharacterized protein n=1 Tax=Smallanthus sonchifolius TaxID=185202 RepID=A0ACB9BT24_9ASTR|nr:hypothetical protein L1987_64927 [Smallanthus sonchifolius]